MRLRPFFPYYGSKWNLARYYPAPARDLVIEPFAGSAGYSCFYGWPRAHLIDADPIVAGVWDYLLRVTPAEILALPELPRVGDTLDDHALPQEAKWLIGFWLNRGSATPKRTRTAYSARTDRGQLNWSAAAKRRIADQLPRIANWTVRHGDYSDAPAVSATWFVDPPYGDKGKYYRHGFTDVSALAAWSLARAGDLIVCEGRGAAWLPFRQMGSFKSTRGRADEVVFVR